MSDTEIRMMRYTIEQLSAELQATRQYVSDIKSKLEHTRKALDLAVDVLKVIAYDENNELDGLEEFAISQMIEKANKTLEQIESITKGE